MQQTFSDLKTKIDNLLKETSHKKIVLILQDIMYTLLSGYVFKIQGNKGFVTIDPIEMKSKKTISGSSMCIKLKTII